MAYIDPLLILQDLPNLVAIKDADFSDVDAVFCCLPHGTTQVGIFIMIFLRYFLSIAVLMKASSYMLCCQLGDQILYWTHLEQCLIASFLSGNY